MEGRTSISGSTTRSKRFELGLLGSALHSSAFSLVPFMTQNLQFDQLIVSPSKFIHQREM